MLRVLVRAIMVVVSGRLDLCLIVVIRLRRGLFLMVTIRAILGLFPASALAPLTIIAPIPVEALSVAVPPNNIFCPVFRLALITTVAGAVRLRVLG